MNWINVTESLPEVVTPVLFIKNGKIDMGVLSTDKIYFNSLTSKRMFWVGEREGKMGVEFWMSLPDAP